MNATRRGRIRNSNSSKIKWPVGQRRGSPRPRRPAGGINEVDDGWSGRKCDEGTGKCQLENTNASEIYTKDSLVKDRIAGGGGWGQGTAA